MAKILLLLCVLPAIVSAHFAGDLFNVKGCVSCDTCRCGFETEASKYIAGAVVRIECRSRVTSKLTYQKETVTNSYGHYTVLVEMITVTRSARVILTRNNGMSSSTRYANAMVSWRVNRCLAADRSGKSTRKQRRIKGRRNRIRSDIL